MARTSNRAYNIDPRLMSLLNEEMVKKLKKSSFTGMLSVEWEDGAIRGLDLHSVLKWGRRRWGSFEDMFDE